MRRFVRWYGANPLHLLTMIACFALAGYAADRLRSGGYVGILVWLGGAVVGHDLILVPLYTLADRSVMAVFRRRPPSLPAVPWINYLRVPAALSAILLLIWFPLIFRLPEGFPDSTGLSLDPYLGHWLAVTGALFLLSAAAFALRLGGRRRGARDHSRRGKTSPRCVAYPRQGTARDGTLRPHHGERQEPANVQPVYDHRASRPGERHEGGRAAPRGEGYLRWRTGWAAGRHRPRWHRPRWHRPRWHRPRWHRPRWHRPA